MKEYIERIEKSQLPALTKAGLRMNIFFAELYEDLKKQGKEPDTKWIDSELRKHGI